VAVANVELTVKRVRVTLSHADYPDRPVLIDFELRHTCLVACVRDTGWLDQLSISQLHAFTATLASLYKLAGVDLVAEQVQANLPPAATWDLTDDGLLVRMGATESPVVCSLRDLDLPAHCESATGNGAIDKPKIEPRRLVFSQYPLNWSQWVTNWEKPANGDGDANGTAWHYQLVHLDTPASAMRIDFHSTPAGATNGEQPAPPADADARIIREQDFGFRAGRPA
jgi:hypothetical protein